MNASLVFNDASLPFQSKVDCEQHLPTFFEVIRCAFKNHVAMIRIDQAIGSDWYKMIYADNFSLSQWLANHTDRDYQRSFKSIMDKSCCPLIHDEENDQLDSFESSSFELNSDQSNVPAIGAAYLLEMPIVSFLSKPQWHGGTICINHEYLDSSANFVCDRNCSVENITQSIGLQPFLDRIQLERQESKDYLKQLVPMNNIDYPNLIFCPDVLGIFVQLGATKKLLSKIKEVLESLDRCIGTANSEAQLRGMLAFTFTGESNATKNDPKLIKYRKFKLPDGAWRTFDLHIKNFTGGQRLYFLPDFQLKKIYIGYFGNHLPV